MTDLVAWLREQIAETERVARAASPGPWTLHTWPDSDACEVEDAEGESALHNGDGYRSWPDGNGEHVVLNDPRATLAQCEAHDAVLHLWEVAQDAVKVAEGTVLTGGTKVRFGAYEKAVVAVALAFQHRPGYREEWRP